MRLCTRIDKCDNVERELLPNAYALPQLDIVCATYELPLKPFITCAAHVLFLTTAAAIPHLVGNKTQFRLTVMMMVTGFVVSLDQAMLFYWFMGTWLCVIEISRGLDMLSYLAVSQKVIA